MHTISHSFDDRQRDRSAAISAFIAGLPDFRRGRIVTASSDPDTWRAKHPAIERRLAGDRAEVVRP